MEALKWINNAVSAEQVPNRNVVQDFKIPESHDELVFTAKLAEQAERYDEMVMCMRKIVKLNAELNVEERNLLSVAYKNIIGTRRSSWRIIASIEAKEHDKGIPENLPMIQTFRKQFEKELSEICEDIAYLLDTFLIPGAQGGEAKVFYYKMKGDYHRYHAEVVQGDQQKKNALDSYEKAMNVANATLAPTHPIRLGLVLNFSVFHYEIMKNHEIGLNLARTAYDEAVSDVDSLDEEPYKESCLILQLLKDNLNLWADDQAQY